jgi:hypothetical protein
VQKIIFIIHQFFLAILVYVLRIVTEENKKTKETNGQIGINGHMRG